MTTRIGRMSQPISEEEIDRTVIAQADKDSAWGRPVRVRKKKMSSLSIPSDLARRAAFLAHLHGLSGLEEWLTRIIRERIEFEEVAFGEVKRELTVRRTINKAIQQPAKRRR